MQTLLQDTRFAMRMLRKGWGVTAIAVASLALAIGGNTTVFGIIETFLFQPIPFEAPERLVVFQERRSVQPEGLNTLSTSLGTWSDLRERSRTADAWTAYRPTTMGLRTGERSEPVPAARVGPDFFDVLGVRVARGRTFRPDEGVAGAPRVAIVTPEFWERARGGEGDPLGAVLSLDGEPWEVIGVMPESFVLLFGTADVLVPLTESSLAGPRDRRDVVSLARLAPGATMDQMRDEARSVLALLEEAHPVAYRDWTLDVFNLREDIPDTRTKLFYGMLQGSVFFVLLIACANIMNLLLARGQERRREIALRTVLGAGRGRIVRQLLTESAVLVTAGGLSGLGLGWYGLHLVAASFAGQLPPGFVPSLNGPVLLFTMGISVVAGLTFGVVPALQTFGQGQAEVLKDGGKSSAGTGRRLLVRGLVVLEIALSLVALGGGGMLVRTFMDLKSVDPGFVGADIVTVQVRAPASSYPDGPVLQTLLEDVLERARGVEGVSAVALANALPQSLQAPTDTFRVQGGDVDASAHPPEAFALAASPGYADVFDLEVLRGRFFAETDGADGAPVAVVNASFAARWFPGGGAVGSRVHAKGREREIVGVVADLKQVVFAAAGGVQDEAVYVPLAQGTSPSVSVAVRAAGAPADVGEPLRQAIQSLDPDLALTPVLTMDERIDRLFVGIDIFNTVLGGFGVLALLLAAVGTYGVLAYSVAQRRQEIGIRMAIGAPARSVVGMIARQGLGMAVLGLVAGGVVMVPLTVLLTNLMAGFAEVDPGTSVVVAALLFVVTVAASLLPAWRASSVRPVQALQDD